MRTFQLNSIVIVIVLIILFYVLFAVFSDLDKIKINFQKINLYYLALILPLMIFAIFLRSLLQRFLLNSIGIPLSIKQNFLLFLAGLSMLITPAGSGQMIKSIFIQRQYNYPLAKSLPLVFAERFFDFLSIITIVLITLIIYFSVTSLFIVLACSTILITIFIAAKNTKILSFLKKLMNKIPFLRNVIPKTSEFDDSVKKLLESSLIIKAWAFDISIFLLEGFVIYLGILSFNIDLGYLQTFQIYYTSVLFGTVSFLPGGVGVLEGTFVGSLLQRHFELALITSIIIFVRLTTTWFVTGLGFIGTYLIMRGSNKKI